MLQGANLRLSLLEKHLCKEDLRQLLSGLGVAKRLQRVFRLTFSCHVETSRRRRQVLRNTSPRLVLEWNHLCCNQGVAVDHVDMPMRALNSHLGRE